MTKPTEKVKPSKVEAHDIAEDVREAQRIAQALEPDDEKCVGLHKLLDAWADAALKLETALYDTRQYAAIRKVEADDLRRQRDELKKREAKNGT